MERSVFQELTMDATIANVTPITDWVDGLLERSAYPDAVIMKINIVIDEIISNISKNAYPETSGQVTVRLQIPENHEDLKLQFVDQGVAFNPLSHEDPDISLALEDREEGGLGILMVKNLMDQVSYERIEEKNILTVYKRV